jgi:hypothetical protein
MRAGKITTRPLKKANVLPKPVIPRRGGVEGPREGAWLGKQTCVVHELGRGPLLVLGMMAGKISAGRRISGASG